MNTIIKTESLGRDYGRVRALDNVNLCIEKGRVVALLGPNGAGKTTFLRLLNGMLEATRGRSEILGVDSRNMPYEVVSRVGYMGDTDQPTCWSTIGQLISLQAGVSEKFDRNFMNQFLDKRGLGLKRSFGSLSKGQKKWVRAGLVLSAGPDVLFLDEPAEGLDPSARVDLYDQLRDYVNESDATAIAATHIIGDIERIADDVAIINHGKIVTYASLEDLREEVREVELGVDEQLPGFGDGVEILGSKKIADVQLVWLRCSQEGQDELERVLGEGRTIRTVSLETFYLAMTEHNGNDKSIVKE